MCYTKRNAKYTGHFFASPVLAHPILAVKVLSNIWNYQPWDFTRVSRVGNYLDIGFRPLFVDGNSSKQGDNSM